MARGASTGRTPRAGDPHYTQGCTSRPRQVHENMRNAMINRPGQQDESKMLDWVRTVAVEIGRPTAYIRYDVVRHVDPPLLSVVEV